MGKIIRIVRVIYKKDGSVVDIYEWEDGRNGVPNRTREGKFYKMQQDLFDDAISKAAEGFQVEIEVTDKEI